jgi:hypothetical protein
MGRIIPNNDSETMWKETVGLLSQQVLEATEENHETPQSGQLVLRARIESDISTVRNCETPGVVSFYDRR